MNPEQWQQKRGHARARSAPIAITVAEIAHRVDDTALAVGAARPAASVGGPVQAEESAVVARQRKP
jgi:hypothetical protein